MQWELAALHRWLKEFVLCVCVSVSAALKYSVALCQQKCKRQGTLETNYCSSNFGKKSSAFFQMCLKHITATHVSLLCACCSLLNSPTSYIYIKGPNPHRIVSSQIYGSSVTISSQISLNKQFTVLLACSCHHLGSSDFSLLISKTYLIVWQEVKQCIG